MVVHLVITSEFAYFVTHNHDFCLIVDSHVLPVKPLTADKFQYQ